MNAKFLFNASLGVVEVEGDEKIVLKVYEDLKSEIKIKIQHAPSNVIINDETEPRDNIATKTSDANKKKKKMPKRGGPSCAERIIELKKSGFFKAQHGNGDVKDGLKKSGHNYATNQVSASLESLHARGELRRSEVGGKWMYSNP